MSLLRLSELYLLVECIPDYSDILFLWQKWAQPDADADSVGRLEVDGVFRCKMLSTNLRLQS